jgi:hypothetical protein
LRVSTQQQGKSGLGIEAQRGAVLDFLHGGQWSLTAEFLEIESGKNNARPQLAAAIKRCRMTHATLIVAKIDRLSRDASFLLTLRDSGIVRKQAETIRIIAFVLAGSVPKPQRAQRRIPMAFPLSAPRPILLLTQKQGWVWTDCASGTELQSR